MDLTIPLLDEEDVHPGAFMQYLDQQKNAGVSTYQPPKPVPPKPPEYYTGYNQYRNQRNFLTAAQREAEHLRGMTAPEGYVETEADVLFEGVPNVTEEVDALVFPSSGQGKSKLDTRGKVGKVFKKDPLKDAFGLGDVDADDFEDGFDYSKYEDPEDLLEIEDYLQQEQERLETENPLFEKTYVEEEEARQAAGQDPLFGEDAFGDPDLDAFIEELKVERAAGIEPVDLGADRPIWEDPLDLYIYEKSWAKKHFPNQPDYTEYPIDLDDVDVEEVREFLDDPDLLSADQREVLLELYEDKGGKLTDLKSYDPIAAEPAEVPAVPMQDIPEKTWLENARDYMFQETDTSAVRAMDEAADTIGGGENWAGTQYGTYDEAGIRPFRMPHAETPGISEFGGIESLSAQEQSIVVGALDQAAAAGGAENAIGFGADG